MMMRSAVCSPILLVCSTLLFVCLSLQAGSMATRCEPSSISRRRCRRSSRRSAKANKITSKGSLARVKKKSCIFTIGQSISLLFCPIQFDFTVRWRWCLRSTMSSLLWSLPSHGVGGQKEARCTCTFGMIYYVDRDKCPRRT
jgi:hypothetical protein